jgi:hypothetical protein
MPARINVPCNGSSGGTHSVGKVPDKITFGTSGNCTYMSFQFVPVDPPPGFSNRQPAGGGGATISYDYDGSQMPATGYTFEYVTTSMKMQGNGTGVIKNN